MLGRVEGHARAQGRAALRSGAPSTRPARANAGAGLSKGVPHAADLSGHSRFRADVYPFIERIARHDPDLAKQLRRASASVVLNTAEGMYARGRQRTASYNIALREMRESYAALEVSVRLRYIAPLPEALEQRVAHILGTLVRLSFPRQRAG